MNEGGQILKGRGIDLDLLFIDSFVHGRLCYGTLRGGGRVPKKVKLVLRNG